MRILAVPNWSFCDPELCRNAVSEACNRVTLHYAQGDIDHARTVTGFSGESVDVFEAMDRLCERLLPLINLGKGGVHPFAGALDVCPFVQLDGDLNELIELVRGWAREFSSRYSIPVHLYERAAQEGAEFRLPVLRGQLGPTSKPFDFGIESNPKWGYSVIGVRDFLLAVNLNFAESEMKLIRHLARSVRDLRESGDQAFVGVRALAFHLEQQKIAQLSLNLTRPDETSVDEICAWVSDQTDCTFSTELIGVIRDVDLPRATLLEPLPAQIVPTL